MAEPLRFHPLVANDLEAAANWYDDISIELGDRFWASIDSRFDAVELRPESFGMVDPPLHAAIVNRFSYLIVFEHSRNAIDVLGVFHSASDPNKWRKRKE
ncbi:plasmid stabilization system [Rhodopirellula baltica SH28]|uniref:Plasmid stabilization system n=1 Tax=Rhodopirellula baltica SH28 TaxID=993517 RepID=K5DLY2_RHOBT|nr:type II toxin-antitoxin system RelE/ParE family toxin [Rhodopirellula baltica]EKK03899.1 plasmid stabilization system [Rhodopirellula baltica SH28]